MAKKKAAKRKTTRKKTAAKTPAKKRTKKAATKRTPRKPAKKSKKPTAKKPAKSSPPEAVEIVRWLTTQDQVAQTLRVSRRTIAEWLSAGMPASIGRYDLLAIALWRLEKLRTREGDPELLKAQRRKLIAQADEAEESAEKKRIANELSRKQLYHADEIDRSAAELVLWIKTQLEAFPDSLRQQFGPEVAREIEESIRQLLNVLAAWQPK